jgi:hypothetical protein
MTDIVQPPRSKRARRTKTLETWLKGRGVDEPEALREACLYASTIDELATAPPEDMDWLTEAWDPRVRSIFLDAVNEARTAIEQGRKPEGAPDEYFEPLPPISAEAVASTLAGMPSQPAAPPPPPTPPKLDSKRSEAHKGAAPRFRMSILTDYAGVVSETVTDERLPAHVEGEENNEDNLEFRTLLNFEKVGRGERKRCVMCGREAEAEDRRRAGCEPQCCVIPKQCKDVCDACTKSTWRHRATDVYFKWCQGCKKFRSIPAFANKRHTAKCDACRKRGREGYHKKVKKNKEDESPAKS